MTKAIKPESISPEQFQENKLAWEILYKEIGYRREKQWKIFSWTNGILVSIIGGVIALTGKDKEFALKPLHKALLISAIITLATYAWIWIKENQNFIERILDRGKRYDIKLDLDVIISRKHRLSRMQRIIGYFGTILLITVAAILTVLFVKSPTL